LKKIEGILHGKNKRILARNLIIAVFFVLVVVFLLTRFTELNQIVSILSKSNWMYVGLAIIFEILWLVNLGFTYQSIYNLLGLRSAKQRMVALTASANFVNIVAPSAGMSGFAVFLADGKKRQFPTGKVTIACMITLMLDYLALTILATLGIVVLINRNSLSSSEIMGISIIFMAVLGILAGLYLSAKSPERLSRMLASIIHFGARIIKPLRTREPDLVEKIHSFTLDTSEGVHTILQNPKGLLAPIIFTFFNKTIQIGILFLLFMAFNTPYSIGTIVAGLAIANMFLIVSPTPSGIGFVEGILTIALKSLHVPIDSAAVITLGFRAITFWLPLVVGMMAFRIFSYNIVKN
jgi:uncharacterized protein (TIRG00374 family)